MSNNNNNIQRRILINNYLNLVDENNSNITNLINIMNNQENTLRRLIFENDRPRNRTQSPSLNNYMPLRTNNLNLSNFNRTRERYTESLSNLDNLLDSFLEPITVTPSREQIERATRQLIYSDIDNSNIHNTTCPISLRRFESDDEVTVIRYCNHIFCRDDLDIWFRSNTRCPLCRYDIRTYVNQQD